MLQDRRLQVSRDRARCHLGSCCHSGLMLRAKELSCCFTNDVITTVQKSWHNEINEDALDFFLEHVRTMLNTTIAWSQMSAILLLDQDFWGGLHII